jgi:hypothetical protein
MTNPTPEPRSNDGASAPDGYLPEPSAVLAQRIGQAVAQAMAVVLQQVPVTVNAPFRCTTCMNGRIGWMTANAVALKLAEERMNVMQAAMEDGNPATRQLNPLSFLPPGTPPLPPVQDGAVMVQGSVFCLEHIPGADQGGKKPFLIASGVLNPRMLAEAMVA